MQGFIATEETLTYLDIGLLVNFDVHLNGPLSRSVGHCELGPLEYEMSQEVANGEVIRRLTF